MLCFGRLVGEGVTIKVPPSAVEREIRVKLIDIRSMHKARLGFIADEDIVIHRDEIWQKILDQAAPAVPIEQDATHGGAAV